MIIHALRGFQVILKKIYNLNSKTFWGVFPNHSPPFFRNQDKENDNETIFDFNFNSLGRK